jgi:hypothetical protein
VNTLAREGRYMRGLVGECPRARLTQQYPTSLPLVSNNLQNPDILVTPVEGFDASVVIA